MLIISCEDVIDVKTPTEQPRLVIDASINWFKGTTGADQDIKLTLTAPYFNNSVPPANGAQISITDSNNQVFNFIEDGQTVSIQTIISFPLLMKPIL